jgi:alkylation response protein AidB-like acyl-CoA dehydrogenase
MVLTLDERDALRDSARGLLARDSTSADVRSVIERGAGFDGRLWAQIVALGWPSIHVSEHLGGAGCGFGDVAVVLHELGRSLTPTPFLASAVLATGALGAAENHVLADPLLEDIAAGRSLGTVALANRDGSYDRSVASTTWRAAGTSIVLNGSAGFVLDAVAADVLVVFATAGDGTLAALAVDRRAPGIRIDATPSVDATQRPYTVSFDEATVGDHHLLTEPGGATEHLADRVLALGAVAAACDATGATERLLELASDYAKERTQFGQPIGAFQAVKHHCANIAIAVAASRAASRSAADALDGDSSEWSAAASVAASYVGPACAHACELGLLVHGGIGFTWEHDAHMFLKRVKFDEALFGRPAWHRQRLADAVFPGLVTA